MPKQIKKDKTFFGVTGLTQTEVDILYTLDGWNPNQDGKSTSINISKELDLSQPTIWRYCDRLRDRKLIIYHSRTKTWRMNPHLKERIKSLDSKQVLPTQSNSAKTDFSYLNRDSS